MRFVIRYRLDRDRTKEMPAMPTLPVVGFAVCLANDGYDVSLCRNKIYAMVEDSEARANGLLRVVDETGEDYLYPAEWFIAVDVPAPVQESVLRAIG
jgi:hypothetical protein